MRRLATLCFPALLFAVPAPAMAANDGVIVFVPPETQPRQSAPAAPASVPAPAPTRGRYGGGFIEALLTGGAAPQPQMAASTASEPATEAEASPSRNFSGRKSTTQDRRRRERLSSTRPTGSCSCRAAWKGAALRHRRRASWLHMVGRQADQPQGRMAGLDAACRDGFAPPRPASPHGWRTRKSTRRESALSRLLALPHSRHQRAFDDRPQRLVGLHPDDERGRDRPLRSRAGRREGDRALKRKRRGAEHASPST